MKTKKHADYREQEIANLAEMLAISLRGSPMTYTSDVARKAAAFIATPDAQRLAELTEAVAYCYSQAGLKVKVN